MPSLSHVLQRNCCMHVACAVSVTEFNSQLTACNSTQLHDSSHHYTLHRSVPAIVRRAAVPARQLPDEYNSQPTAYNSTQLHDSSHHCTRATCYDKLHKHAVRTCACMLLISTWIIHVNICQRKKVHVVVYTNFIVMVRLLPSVSLSMPCQRLPTRPPAGGVGFRNRRPRPSLHVSPSRTFAPTFGATENPSAAKPSAVSGQAGPGGMTRTNTKPTPQGFRPLLPINTRF
jgi:hypothetical protein